MLNEAYRNKQTTLNREWYKIYRLFWFKEQEFNIIISAEPAENQSYLRRTF